MRWIVRISHVPVPVMIIATVRSKFVVSPRAPSLTGSHRPALPTPGPDPIHTQQRGNGHIARSSSRECSVLSIRIPGTYLPYVNFTRSSFAQEMRHSNETHLHSWRQRDVNSVGSGRHCAIQQSPCDSIQRVLERGSVDEVIPCGCLNVKSAHCL